METEIKLEEYKAELVSEDEGRKLLLLLDVPDNPQKILLSDTDQKDLDKVFYSLIDELLRRPFKFKYIANQKEELMGMNQVSNKYVEILNNDLQGILDEKKAELIASNLDIIK